MYIVGPTCLLLAASVPKQLLYEGNTTGCTVGPTPTYLQEIRWIIH